MTSEYRRVLRDWAKGQIPDAVTIETVKFDYDEGYRYSSYTFENPSFKIVIDYLDAQGEMKTKYLDQDRDIRTMGDLLRELFKLADAEDQP